MLAMIRKAPINCFAEKTSWRRTIAPRISQMARDAKRIVKATSRVNVDNRILLHIKVKVF